MNMQPSAIQTFRQMAGQIARMSFRCVECKKTHYSWVGSVQTPTGRRCAGCAKGEK